MVEDQRLGLSVAISLYADRISPDRSQLAVQSLATRGTQALLSSQSVTRGLSQLRLSLQLGNASRD